MADKSWGVSGPSSPVEADDTARLAAGRTGAPSPSSERAEAMARRQDLRSARREADAQAREQARTQRREEEQRLAAGDPHAAAARRHRSSGRKDVVREQRDTRGYATIVDAERIRALAARGASVSGLSAVFGISEDEVEHALAGTE